MVFGKSIDQFSGVVMVKKLIISPHVDDEVLGCGGILNSDCLVLYCGLDESLIDKGKNRPSSDIRIEELKKVVEITGHKFNILKHKVNHYDEHLLIGDIEEVINSYKPEEIYIPHPSYNQDHRESYNASLVALRPHDINHFVKKVLVYEQPHVAFWDNNDVPFKPNYFVPIDLEKKKKIYELMESQVRSFRSPSHIEALAALRGGMSQQKYAEAFHILRWVVE
jgi:LmbE family N-acetylglucosaminyl deacetylase